MNSKDAELDLLTGYRAMFLFLAKYWQRGKSKEIAMLLGSMAISQDGKAMDPAMWKDWPAAVDEVRTSGG